MARDAKGCQGMPKDAKGCHGCQGMPGDAKGCHKWYIKSKINYFCSLPFVKSQSQNQN